MCYRCTRKASAGCVTQKVKELKELTIVQLTTSIVWRITDKLSNWWYVIRLQVYQESISKLYDREVKEFMESAKAKLAPTKSERRGKIPASRNFH